MEAAKHLVFGKLLAATSRYRAEAALFGRTTPGNVARGFPIVAGEGILRLDDHPSAGNVIVLGSGADLIFSNLLGAQPAQTWGAASNAYLTKQAELRPDVVAGFYEADLQRAVTDVEQLQNERLLSAAFESRGLMTALMEGSWLGLELLARLAAYENGYVASELAIITTRDVDEVASILARLVRFGGAEVHGLSFLCSREGRDVIYNLERSTGIDLTP